MEWACGETPAVELRARLVCEACLEVELGGSTFVDFAQGNGTAVVLHETLGNFRAILGLIARELFRKLIGDLGCGDAVSPLATRPLLIGMRATPSTADTLRRVGCTDLWAIPRRLALGTVLDSLDEMAHDGTGRIP